MTKIFCVVILPAPAQGAPAQQLQPHPSGCVHTRVQYQAGRRTRTGNPLAASSPPRGLKCSLKFEVTVDPPAFLLTETCYQSVVRLGFLISQLHMSLLSVWSFSLASSTQQPTLCLSPVSKSVLSDILFTLEEQLHCSRIISLWTQSVSSQSQRPAVSLSSYIKRRPYHEG